jgi:hypothetical protein
MYLPINGILSQFRKELGFKALPSAQDREIHSISLVRNCLLHNRSRVDAALAAVDRKFSEGDQLVIGLDDVGNAVTVLRKFAYEMDKLIPSG